MRGFGIREAHSAEDYQAFGAIVRAYVDWCRVRFADDHWLVDTAFSLQSLDSELEDLAKKYAPPKGKALLALDGQTPIGAVAYRKLEDDVCEMKRLFVLDGQAGRGVGRALCGALIDLARADGFSRMRLDTTRAMHEAVALYESMGFAPIAPYIDYPARMMPEMVFLERDLAR